MESHVCSNGAARWGAISAKHEGNYLGCILQENISDKSSFHSWLIQNLPDILILKIENT